MRLVSLVERFHCSPLHLHCHMTVTCNLLFSQADDSSSSSDEDSVSPLPAPSSDLPAPPLPQATPTKSKATRVKFKHSMSSAPSASLQPGSRKTNLHRTRQTGSEPLLPRPFPESISSSSDEDTAPLPPPPFPVLPPDATPPTSDIAMATTSDPLGVLGSGMEAVTLASLPGEGPGVRTKAVRLHNGQPQASLSCAGNTDTADIFEVGGEAGASADQTLFSKKQDDSLAGAVKEVHVQ